VTNRFDAGPGDPPELVVQELYPYATGGPVTYTPPGQRLFGARGMSITAGWFRASPEFFRYLVDQGLPETTPPIPADRVGADSGVPAPTAWRWIAMGFAGLTAILWRLRQNVRQRSPIARA
jgi:hypothetical protein